MRFSILIPHVEHTIAILLIALCSPTFGQSVSDVFTVASGSSPSNCDQYIGTLNAQFTEALAIGAAGSAVMSKIKKGQNLLSRSERRMLYAMYGLDVYDYVTGEDGGRLISGDAGRIKNIRTFFATVSSATSLGGVFKSTSPPKLYCDSTFLKWTTEQIDPATGQSTGQPISAIIPGATGAYWYADEKAYVEDTPPTTPKQSPCEGGTLGFKVQGQNAIALCPELFASTDWKSSLQNYKNDQTLIHAGDELYNTYKSVPGAFLHEMVHLVSMGAITDVSEYDGAGNKVPNGVSYGFQACFNLASKGGDPDGRDLAQLNADNYHIFALASYLDKWDWADGVAAPLML